MNDEPQQPNGPPPASEQPPSHADGNGQAADGFVPGPGKLHPIMAANKWRPGQTGNPKGSNGASKIKNYLRRMGQSNKIRIKKTDGSGSEDISWLDAFCRRLWADGMNGKPMAQRIISETLWPQKGNRIIVQKNTMELVFQLDSPPGDNEQAAFYNALIDQADSVNGANGHANGSH